MIKMTSEVALLFVKCQRVTAAIPPHLSNCMGPGRALALPRSDDDWPAGKDLQAAKSPSHRDKPGGDGSLPRNTSSRSVVFPPGQARRRTRLGRVLRLLDNNMGGRISAWCAFVKADLDVFERFDQ